VSNHEEFSNRSQISLTEMHTRWYLFWNGRREFQQRLGSKKVVFTSSSAYVQWWAKVTVGHRWPESRLSVS